jgi:hypothetical protein
VVREPPTHLQKNGLLNKIAVIVFYKYFLKGNNMSPKIYKLCLIRGYTEAYYQLSEAEKSKLWEQVGNVIEKSSAKMATPYYNARWSNDKYMTFFIMEYPDIEAAMADTEGVEKAELYRYLVSETILATELTQPSI